MYTEEETIAPPIDYTKLAPLTKEDMTRIKDTLAECLNVYPGINALRVLNLSDWLRSVYVARMVAEIERWQAVVGQWESYDRAIQPYLQGED